MKKRSARNTKGRIVSAAWQLFYRYGYDNCYDVVEANPMQKDSFVPLGGYIDCAESRSVGG